MLAFLSAGMARAPKASRDPGLREKLQAITEIDLSELLAVDPPRGYGRDDADHPRELTKDPPRIAPTHL